MTGGHRSQLDSLIDSIRSHPSADFYRVRWEKAKTFEELPTISRKDFLDVPLSQRRYKDARSFVKIVHDKDRMFLSEWSFEDIGHEPWGTSATRPLVYLADPHEAIEKSMWCYENNIVPLIGEPDPDIAMFTASKYRINALITDTVSLPKLLPFLEKQERPLSSITVLGDSFDAPALASFARFAGRSRLVLRLPETGAFAESPLGPVSFVALPDCIVSEEDGAVVITKTAQLVTPIIRYRTNLPAGSVHSRDGEAV